MATKKRTHTLTVFLAKPGVAESDLLDGQKGPAKTTIRRSGVHLGTLYSRASQTRPPSWTSFFGNAIDATALGLRTASASAALVVPVKKRLCALTFGHGRLGLPRFRRHSG